MILLIACIVAIAGYYAWQHGRYERIAPREAHRRALADAVALATIIGCQLAVNWLGTHQGLTRLAGGGGWILGSIIGVLLGHPLRRALLRGMRLNADGPV